MIIDLTTDTTPYQLSLLARDLSTNLQHLLCALHCLS